MSGSSRSNRFAGGASCFECVDALGSRFYDPSTGRFLSKDPLGGGYAYAGDNPANGRDPSGKKPHLGRVIRTPSGRDQDLDIDYCFQEHWIIKWRLLGRPEQLHELGSRRTGLGDSSDLWNRCRSRDDFRRGNNLGRSGMD